MHAMSHSTQQQGAPSGHGINVTEAVIADLQTRMAYGTRLYGMPLQTANGRDALLDAYQEALDLACYLKQALLERASHADR